MPKLQPVEIRNGALNLAGESLWWFQMWMVAPATVLTLLLRSYGASEAMVGGISAIEGGLLVLPQILGVYLFHSRARRKRQVVLYHFFTIIPFLALIGLFAHPGLVLGNNIRCWLILGCFGMHIFSAGVIAPVWADWMAHLFRREIRGRVIGGALCVGSVAGMGGALLAGHLISRRPEMSTYAWLYILAAAVGVVSILIFLALKDDASVTNDPPAPSAKEIVRHFRHSLVDVNFRRFLIGRMLAVSGFCVTPFVAVYYSSANGGQLLSSTIVSCGAAQEAGLAVALLGLGYLGDHKGHRLGVLLGTAMQVVALTLLLTSSGVMSCLAVYACLGVCIGSATVSCMNILYETCPHDNRMAHITLGNLAMVLPALIVPLIAGQVAKHLGLTVLFTGCLSLSLLALAWFWLRTKDPRDVDIRNVLPPSEDQAQNVQLPSGKLG